MFLLWENGPTGTKFPQGLFLFPGAFGARVKPHGPKKTGQRNLLIL
jgi:hypothetical protein